MDLSLAHMLQAAGRAPLVQGAAIIAGTFILEDATTAVTAMAVQSGVVDLPLALGALYAGIVLGDIGLYGLGRLAARVPWAMRLIPAPSQQRGRDWLDRHLVKIVFTARFLPGVRLPAYTACGFFNARFYQFVLAAIGATLIWTSALFALSLRAGTMLIEHLGAWGWLGFAALLAAILTAGRLVARSQARQL